MRIGCVDAEIIEAKVESKSSPSPRIERQPTALFVSRSAYFCLPAAQFVMDEADKLLSPEFVPLIDRLLSYTPPTRQILCFSATFPITVKDFAQKWLTDVYEINLMEELTLKGITQYYAFVEESQKVVSIKFAKCER